jgi:hypothetical protein
LKDSIGLIELLAKFWGLFFEHPSLSLIVVVGAPVVPASFYANYLWVRGRSGNIRRFAPEFAKAYIAIFLPLVLIAWQFYRYWGLPHSFATSEIGILVAEVPNQTSPEQQIAYQNTLRAYIQNSSELRDVAKVRLIERPLPEDSEAAQAEATKIGHWLQASFVLRPYVVGSIQEPWLTVVKASPLFTPESRLESCSPPGRSFPCASQPGASGNAWRWCCTRGRRAYPPCEHRR